MEELALEAERRAGGLVVPEAPSAGFAAAARDLLIDEQLRMAGWEADSEALRHATWGRPEKERNRAIAEWPTASGPCDQEVAREICAALLSGCSTRDRHDAVSEERA